MLCIIGFIFTPMYPPMVDIPQHAGQVAALKAMLEGNFHWGNLVYIDWKSPYWLGYGIWLALSLVLPFLLATKTMVALAFLGFVGSFAFLRRFFKAPQCLDWFFFPSFFGFAFQGGMLTFLLAMPFGILFYYENIKAAERPICANLVKVFVCGVVLLFSHGLVFLFFSLVSMLHVVLSGNAKNFKLIIPYFFLLILVALIYKNAEKLEPVYASVNGYYFQTMQNLQVGNPVLAWPRKLLNLPHDIWLPNPVFSNYLFQMGSMEQVLLKSWLPFLILLACLSYPFLCGLRLSENIAARSMLIAFLLVLFLLPDFAFDTAFIQRRFSCLFLPSWMLCFEGCKNAKSGALLEKKTLLLCVLLAITMYWPIKYLTTFDQETVDFNNVLAKAPNNERALSLILSPNGKYINNIFVQMPAWYQALKGGWIDFNWARFNPPVLHYQKKSIADIRLINHWRPMAVLHGLHACNRIFNLIFIRAKQSQGINENFLKDTQCNNYKMIAQSGEWSLWERNHKMPISGNMHPQ
jgi:hypothetical protein